MNLRSLIYLFGLALVFALLAGCSETPEKKAAREAREQAQKATAVVEDYKLESGYDYESAKKEVDKAVSLAAKAGGDADSVYFASGELTTAYASKQQNQISKDQEILAEKMQQCVQLARQLSNYQAQIDTVKMLMGSGEQEAGSLKELLNSEKDGIEAKLKEAEDKLASLNTKLKSYEQAAQEAKQAADDIRAKADKMLREAELLSGEARIATERKAYELLEGKGDGAESVFHYQQVYQNNLDAAQAAEVVINTVKPLIPKLQDDIAYVGQRISELENQDASLDFSGQLALLKDEYEKFEQRLGSKLEEFNNAFETFKNDVAAQTELYEQALSSYAKVKSEGLRENAQLKIAESKKAIATLNARSYDFVERIAANASAAASIKVNDALKEMNDLSSSLSQSAADYAQKAKDMFSEAFEQYQEVIDRYSGDFADVAARSYMAAIYQRMNFEGLSDDLDALKDELIAKVEQIKDISIQADPKFANSKVASLFGEYGIEFKTAEQKLQEKYLELKVAFSGLGTLSGDQKQQRMLSLLDDLKALDKPQDEQFYNDLVKYIYEMYREDWLAIYEMQPDSDRLDIFSSQIAMDTAEEEPADTGEMDVNDPNS
jgi:hypothetical protein